MERWRGLGALPDGDGLRMLHVVTGSLRLARLSRRQGTVIAPGGLLVAAPPVGILDIRIFPAR